MPIVGFLPSDDPRVRGTVDAIEQELTVDGFVLRYRTEAGADGLPPGEGVFLPCSFWLADNYTLQNRDAEAFALFERLLGLCSDVGLLAEEYDPNARRQVGNFPQAFSQLALIGTAESARDRPGAAAWAGSKAWIVKSEESIRGGKRTIITFQHNNFARALMPTALIGRRDCLFSLFRTSRTGELSSCVGLDYQLRRTATKVGAFVEFYAGTVQCSVEVPLRPMQIASAHSPAARSSTNAGAR
jgi:hypothetical protein